MKALRRGTTRLSVEELESRTVLSTLTAPSFFDSAAQVLHSVSTTSSNWSGYAAETNLNAPASSAVSAVAGSWVVPTVTGTGTAYSSVWVGIDGYSSSTVEQIGTDSDIVNGKATYYAWYEMYPNASINITSLTVNPGDTISASVNYVASTSKFTLSISDSTTGKSYSPAAQTVSGALRSSAEWIVEAPSSNYGILPLANFGTAKFLSASATISGVTGPVDDFANAAINMVSSYTEDTTSALTDTTTAPITSSFTVTYDAPPTFTGGGGRHGPPPWGGFGWFTVNVAAESKAVPLNNGSISVSPLAVGSSNVAEPSQTPAYVTSALRADAPSAVSGFAPVSSSGAPTDGDRPTPSPEKNESTEIPMSVNPSSGPLGAFDGYGSALSEHPDLVCFPNSDGDAPEISGDDASTDFTYFSRAGVGMAAAFLAYWSNPSENPRKQLQPLLFDALPSR